MKRALQTVLFSFFATAVAAGEGPLGEEELEARRRKLDSWTFEPVALEGGSFRIEIDRKDSSFSFRDRRSSSRFLSSWGRRGYASVQLADGRELAVDRISSLNASGERVRFRAGSSAGELPPLFLEIEVPRSGSTAAFRFEIPPEGRERIVSVTLLDGAFWTADSDGGGVSLPRGLGEWLSASDAGREEMTLRGSARIVPGARFSYPGDAYSLPLLGIRRGDASVLLFWRAPDVKVRVVRRAVDDGAFPGRQETSVSLTFSGERGEAHVAGGALPEVGHLDISRIYRDIRARELRSSSLRYKAAQKRELVGFPGAVFFPLSLTAPPVPPSSCGDALHTFDEVARIAEHLEEKLELENVVVLLNDWVGSGSGTSASLFSAAEECGGDRGLADCARRVREAGFLLGLAVDREQLVTDRDAGRPTGEEAWREALRIARSESGLPALRELCAPQLLVVREPPGEGADSGLLEARAELARYIRERFSLWGTNLGSELDLENAAYFENLFSKRSLADLGRVYPLFSAVYGQHVRLAPNAGESLRPNDAAAVLHVALFGLAAAFALPPQLYFEAPPEETGESPEWCFAREGGWTAGRGLSPRDVFLKNAYELCSPLAGFQAREPLIIHRALTPDGNVRESRFGYDMRIVANLGAENYMDEPSGALLPPYGFVVRYPFFFAFHALRIEGLDYESPAFFTVRSLEGKLYLRAERTRIYHGFGPSRIRLGGREFTVEREAVVKIW